VELAGFDDKKLTVMPVLVPEVTYSDIKVDSRYVYFMGMTLYTSVEGIIP